MSLAHPNPHGISPALRENVAATPSEELGEDVVVEEAERLARPTFWPAGIAFGITLLAWGLITSFVLIAGGFAVFLVSLIGWIGELRHE